MSLLCLVGGGLLAAQGSYQPFGVDVENLDVSKCNHNVGVGCPLVDQAAAAGAQWMRLFAWWYYLEPSNGSYNLGELPWQIAYAQSKGIQVYLTATWAPPWANGAQITCNPVSHGGADCPQPQDEGATVLNSTYTYDFFYNLATQFNGSGGGYTSSYCGTGSSYNADYCHPLVQYFGTWNEPDGMNNYNDKEYDPYNLGNYLNDFVNQFLQPAYNGIKAANPSAYELVEKLNRA
jgi:hypothetical protein